jgi:hypothetical protein
MSILWSRAVIEYSLLKKSYLIFIVKDFNSFLKVPELINGKNSVFLKSPRKEGGERGV